MLGWPMSGWISDGSGGGIASVTMMACDEPLGSVPNARKERKQPKEQF